MRGNKWLVILGVAVCSALSLPAQSDPVKPWKADLHFELRSTQDRRPPPQARSETVFQRATLGIEDRIADNLLGRFSLSMEHFESDSRYYVDEAYLSWTIPWSQIRIGQQYLDVGLFNVHDDLFSSMPAYTRLLFGAENDVDLGLQVSLFPWNQKWLYLEAGRFAGELVRAEDERRGHAKTPPTYVSLKSESSWYQAFLTYFAHELPYADPVHATGAGFEISGTVYKDVSAAVISEVWDFTQIQKDGPDQRNLAGTVYLSARWRHLGAGWRWSESKSKLMSTNGADRLPTADGRLFHLDFIWNSSARLRLERVQEIQDEVLRDEWVGRLLVDLKF